MSENSYLNQEISNNVGNESEEEITDFDKYKIEAVKNYKRLKEDNAKMLEALKSLLNSYRVSGHLLNFDVSIAREAVAQAEGSGNE